MDNSREVCGVCSKPFGDQPSTSSQANCGGTCRESALQTEKMDCQPLDLSKTSQMDCLSSQVRRSCGIDGTIPLKISKYADTKFSISTAYIIDNPVLLLEIVRKVFTHLSVVDLKNSRSVNRLWRSTVDNDPSFLKNVNLKFPKLIDRDVNPKFLLPIPRISFDKCAILAIRSWWSTLLGQCLTHLTLTESCRISLSTLLKMLRKTPNLKYFNLAYEVLEDSAFLDENSNFRLEKLESFELLNLAPRRKKLLPLFGRIFPRLKVLKLPSQYDEYVEVIEMIQRLQDTLEGISLNTSWNVLETLTKLKRLKQVSFIANMNCRSEGSLKEKMLRFSQSQSKLEDLHFGVSGYWRPLGYDLNRNTLAQIMQHLPKLKRLSFEQIPDHNVLNEDILQNLDLTHLPQLEYFEIVGSYRNEPNLSFIKLKTLPLTELYLNSIKLTLDYRLQDFFVAAVNLRVITLAFCSLREWSDLFTPTQSRTLRRLFLNSVQVQHNSTDCFYEYFDELRYLELHGNMSKEVLLAMIRVCPNVQEMAYSQWDSGCDKDVIKMIRRKMKQLRKLSLIASNFPNTTLNTLIKHGRKLEQLKLDGADIQPEHIVQLAEIATELVLKDIVINH